MKGTVLKMEDTIRYMKRYSYLKGTFYDRDCTQWELYMKRTASQKNYTYIKVTVNSRDTPFHGHFASPKPPQNFTPRVYPSTHNILSDKDNKMRLI